MGSLAHLITRKWVAGLLALFAILGTGAVIGLVGQAESPATGTAALPNGTDSRAGRRAARPAAPGRGLGRRRALQQRPAAHARTSSPWCRSAPARLPGATGAPAGRGRRRHRRHGLRPGHHQGCRRDRRRRHRPAHGGQGRPARRRSPRRSPARPPSRPTSRPSSTAPTSGCSPPPASVVAILLVITYRSPFLWLVPLTVVGVADQLAAVLATHTLAALRRALGRVDDRHPLGARLRRRHRLRPAADLAATATSCGSPTTAARPWRSRCTRTAEAVLSSADHRRARPAHPAALALPGHPRPRPGLRGRRRRGRDLRARRAARRPGRLRALDLLAARCRTSARPAWPTATRSGAGSATPSPSAPPASSPSPSSCSASWPAASPRSRPASTRPTSSSRSPRPSRRASGWRSPSRPAPPTRPTS